MNAPVKPKWCFLTHCPPYADPDVRRVPPSRERTQHVALRAVK